MRGQKNRTNRLLWQKWSQMLCWSPNQIRAGSRGVIDELIVELLINTGLRASELCNLNIGDLPVRHGKDCIWVRDGKGKVSRTVDISDKLKKRLERFVKLYRKRARANSALLVSERGDRIIYRSIYAKIKRIGEQAGIGKLHPHMLRHNYLTRLYNIEKDLRFVQDQAGHASQQQQPFMPRRTARPESGRYRRVCD